MPQKAGSSSVSRRKFLASTSGLVAAGPVVSRGASVVGEARPEAPAIPQPARAAPAGQKLLIGVFDPVYNDLSLDEMLEKITALGLEAVEIGTGGYPASPHCPVAELLADPAKAKAWKRKFEDLNIRVATLSCHGNPVHPDPARAARDAQIFRNTVLLAERLEVPVIVGFSGCPGGSPADKMPNWVTYKWPPEYMEIYKYQWSVLVPYWKEAARFARDHGIRRLAFEMHPGFCVYNPATLLKLREAVGEEIGANCDLSHLFWQGCNPVEVIHYLGKQGCIYHAHMKDTVVFPNEAAVNGVLNFQAEPTQKNPGSVIFRAVGYGHGAQLWKDVVKAYMDVGYEGILSIENEDPILPGEVGVERAAYVLKNIRAELLGPTA